MRAQKFDQFLTLKNTQEPDSEGVLEDAVLEHMVSSLMTRYDHTFMSYDHISYHKMIRSYDHMVSAEQLDEKIMYHVIAEYLNI